ncbi:unnamed protein product [Brugia pahangi]|uniref:Ovule protein n=1 Tax=Brugia pahangi TaxID=6280 RepID=A0A0N4TL30_BRUPA|nr:unnamed protein product [Brugia pahangi]
MVLLLFVSFGWNVFNNFLLLQAIFFFGSYLFLFVRMMIKAERRGRLEYFYFQCCEEPFHFTLTSCTINR